MQPTVYVSEHKIAIPRVPDEFVPRPALRDLLDHADPRDLVVVCAPAGYGKSLMLADWAGRHRARTAWVTVDQGDNDPRHLWAAVRAAIASRFTVPLEGPGRRPWHEGRNVSPVDDLLVVVEQLDEPLVLVLDDLHEIISVEVLHELARFVRWRPAPLRLVLASRVDPPFALARLRLDGRLCEVRTQQLRFTGEEAAALLANSGCELRPEQTADLVSRTEGWAAGIRLAAVALRRDGDPDRFLAEFSGDERSVADYLTGEMMASLTEASLDLLRSVSVCSQMSGDLAVGLSGRDDARLQLDRLAHETGLIEVGPTDTYRIHALLRSYLQATLKRRNRSGHQQLHEFAARWWAGREDPVHALRHAERAENDALLGDLLRSFGVSMMLRGETEPLRRGLAVTRARARGSDPALVLLSAFDHFRRRGPAAAADLALARSIWPAEADDRLSALLASTELVATAFTDVPPAVRELAVEDLPPDHRALLHAARGAWAMGHAAERAAARGEIEQALGFAQKHAYGLLEVQCLTWLAVLAWTRGDGAELDERATAAVNTAARCGHHPSTWSSCAAALLAHRALLGGDPHAAAERANEALGRRAEVEPESALLLHAVRAAAGSDTGGGAAALADVRAARAHFGDVTRPHEWLVAPVMLEHRIDLLVGNPGAATGLVDWLQERVGMIGEIAVLRAMIDAAAGDLDAAESAIEPVRRGELVAMLPDTALEVALLEAAAAMDRGDHSAARTHFDTAIDLGRSLGVVRPFALAAPLLRQAIARRSHAGSAFAHRLSAALAAVRPTVTAALSEREAAVLALLPSLLSAREIGGELGISHNTVKTHVRSIYVKFGVSRRRDAVDQARQRGLLA